MHQISDIIQRRDLIFVRGWVKFIPSLALLFYLTLPVSCLTRSAKIKSHLCNAIYALYANSLKRVDAKLKTSHKSGVLRVGLKRGRLGWMPKCVVVGERAFFRSVVRTTVSAFLSLGVRRFGGGGGRQRFNVAENGSASYSPSSALSPSLPLSLSVPVRSDSGRSATGAARWSMVGAGQGCS